MRGVIEMEKENLYVSEAFKEALEKLNSTIDQQRKIQSTYVNYTKEYGEALKEEIKLLKLKNKAIDTESQKLKKKLSR
jgi:hypothetical protein